MQAIQIRISDIIAPSFIGLHNKIKESKLSQFWIYGGRGSTKSSFVAIEIILNLIKDPKANALCLRKTKESLRKSIFANLRWAIDTLGLDNYFRCTVSPMEIIYIPTGQAIYFAGLDDPEKIKSIKARQGYFKILWFEELPEFNSLEDIRSVEQSVLRGGDDFLEFLTYNPPNDPNSWVNIEKEKPNEDRFIHQSTYLDVPIDWLGKRFIADAERLKKNNFEAYRHEYLGEVVGNCERLVFNQKWQEKEFETPSIERMFNNRFYHGADWGFANDPTVLIRCFIIDDCLYIDYESCGIGVEFEDLPALFNKIPTAKVWPIKADCARPETISFMKNKGYNIVGAKKWKDSDKEGIEFLRSFRNIYIHPRCKKTIEEFKKYSYKVDKENNVLPILEDANNHCIDAIRYALVDYICKKFSILDVI